MNQNLTISANDVSMEMIYEIFYRQYGVRRLSKLAGPKWTPVNALPEVEFQTLHYYVPQTDGMGISQNNPFVTNRAKKQMVYHWTEMPMVAGSGHRKRPFIVRKAILAYHKINPELKWLRTEKHYKSFGSKRPFNMIVDYSLMGKRLFLRDNPRLPKQRFDAYYTGYLKGVEHFLKVEGRRHAILMHFPDSIPSRSEFVRASKELKLAFMKIFDTDTKLALLDFWKWLDPVTRKESLLGKYIDEKYYGIVDLYFLYKNHVCPINLAKLAEWIEGGGDIEDGDDENEMDEDVVSHGKSVKVQKMFLRFLNETLSNETLNQTQPTNTDVEQVAAIEKVYAEADESTLEKEQEESDKTLEENPDVRETIRESTQKETDSGTPKETATTVPSVDEPENVVSEKTEKGANASRDPLTVSAKPSSDPTPTLPVPPANLIKVDKKALWLEFTGGKKPGEMVKITENIDKETHHEIDNYVSIHESSVREADYWKKTAERYKKIPSPYNSAKTLEEFITEPVETKIDEKEITIPDIPLVTDKTMLRSSLISFDNHYIEKILPADITKNILATQKTGLLVTDYKVEHVKDVATEYDVHVIQYTPVGGSPSTVRMRVPHIREDGTYLKGGIQYRMRKQRIDQPIRKVGENRVALTSYYDSKLFIRRCPKKKYDVFSWVLRMADLQAMNKDWTDVVYGKTNTTIKTLPLILQPLMTRYKSFTFNGVSFDFTDIKETKEGVSLPGGIQYSSRTGKWSRHGEEIAESALFGINVNAGPAAFAEVKILGETFPVGFILARSLGFGKLVNLLGLDPVKLEPKQHLPTDGEYLVIKFADEKWAFPKRELSYESQLILNGMNYWDKSLLQYSVEEFNEKGAFGSVLMDNGIKLRYERELDLLDEMFIDPITLDTLTSMGEPTTMNGLYVRAVELLATSHHVDEINMDDMMIKGYERVPGAVYRALIKNIRQFKSKTITSKRKIEMKPDDVWLAIAQDPATEIVNDINPIQNLKEKENITFTGEGGRSKLSMTRNTVGYHETDLGVISEATVDSTDVGITTFTSADPVFDSYRGNKVGTKPKDLNPANLLSTTAMLSPFIMGDDGKRVMFASVQISHRIPIKGAMPSPIRTGYENILAHRVDEKFAYAAKDAGTVIEKGAKYVVIRYNNGGVVKLEIGLKIMSSSGSYFKHTIVCDLPVGHKFAKGDVIIFNSAFFTRDVLNIKQIVPCDKLYSRTLLIESNDTFEDSSAISGQLADSLKTTSVKKRVVVLNATDMISDIVKIGEEVDLDKPLLIIHDENVRQLDNFDKHASDVLMRMSNVSPKAKYKGKVLQINVVYFCEEDALSDSIRKVVEEINQKIFAGTKTSLAEKRMLNGKINEPIQVDGQIVMPGQVAISVFIEHELGTSGGDKIVFSHQLKSVIARTFTGKHETESGLPIHSMFGYSSISNRIVTSPILMATTFTLLKLVTKQALEAYDSAS